MSKFEPKITPFNGVYCYEDVKGWCRRNIDDNLRRFKAEFLRRFNSAEMLTSQEIVIDMLPDDPPKATGDDAADAARFRWMIDNFARVVCLTTNPEKPQWSVEFYGADGNWIVGRAKPNRIEAIDAAMAREAAK